MALFINSHKASGKCLLAFKLATASKIRFIVSLNNRTVTLNCGKMDPSQIKAQAQAQACLLGAHLHVLLYSGFISLQHYCLPFPYSMSVAAHNFHGTSAMGAPMSSTEAS